MIHWYMWLLIVYFTFNIAVILDKYCEDGHGWSDDKDVVILVLFFGMPLVIAITIQTFIKNLKRIKEKEGEK